MGQRLEIMHEILKKNRILTSFARRKYSVLVREAVPKRLDTRTAGSLYPLAARDLGRRLSEESSCPLVLAAETEGLVASAERRSG